MTRKLVLHAGMHKTGSTSIQTFLHGARITGAAYIPSRNPNQSNLFVTLFAAQPEAYWVFRRRQLSKEVLAARREKQAQRIARQIRKSPVRTWIFSAEKISTAPRPELEACRAYFAPFFDEISVYAYLREPVDGAASRFQQGLKTGGLPGPAQLLPGFETHIQALDDVFGRDNVHLRQFRDPRRPSQNVVTDFCDWIGISAEGDRAVSVNTALSADAVALLYLFRRHARFALTSPAAVAQNRQLVAALSGLAGPRLGLGAAFLDGQRAQLAADTAWLEARMGQPLAPPAQREAVMMDSLAAIEAHGRAVFRQRAGRDFTPAEWQSGTEDVAARFVQAVL